MLDTARDKLQSLTNARGRSTGHVAAGLLFCGAAVGLALAARKRRGPQKRSAADVIATLWRPVVLASALSGIRIWNAPDSEDRNRALGFWAALQGLSAALGLIGPRHQGARLAAAAAGLGAGVGYVSAARKVDATAASLVSPHVGWSRIAGLLPRAGEAAVDTAHPTLH